MGALRLGWVALLLIPALSLAQRIQVPAGRKHFIVLVDSSYSMVADSARPARRDAKRQALSEAENKLAKVLFDDGWYRPGKDLLSVVQYGFGTSGPANQAYKRLYSASLGDDYARAVLKLQSNVDRQSFLGSLRPKARTQLNVLAWALPMGLASVAPSDSTQIQDTFVIMLNDAQMNEGSILLEKVTLGKHLNNSAKTRLEQNEKRLSELVRLTDGEGQPGAYQQFSFGPDIDPIVITIFKATSRISMKAADRYRSLDPLEGVSLAWEGPETLGIHFSAPSEIRGKPAKVRIDGKVGHASGTAALSMSSYAKVAGMSIDGAGVNAHLALLVEGHSTNPLLGSQTYNVVFEREVLIPNSPYAHGRWWTGLLMLLAVGGVGGGIWAWYQRHVARHFRFWLPDYTLPASLPAISQEANSHFSSRVPRYDGDEAAWLELPHPLIRSLFYKDATVQWDDRLEVPGFAGETEATMSRLPRFVSFLWTSRPSSGGEYDVIISRPASKQRNQRMKATVRFLSLPKLEAPEPIEP